jgi:hypothetical protein
LRNKSENTDKYNCLKKFQTKEMAKDIKFEARDGLKRGVDALANAEDTRAKRS